MRTMLAAAACCFAMQALAQDWALLNPAYRYNYSNDGTDTISNQIRVMQVDTLGPDSFRYELNLIGVVCDTCPASLGGPCDGCFVRVNQPQFLGYDCIRTGDDWTFNGVDTFLIKSSASLGDTWVFRNGVIATIDQVWAAEVFGIQDSLKRVLLSDGDTILLSRLSGIVGFEQSGEYHDLLGVEGAGVGRLFPDPLDYFDFQPGDELTYQIRAVREQYNPGGPITYVPVDIFQRIVIIARYQTLDTLQYSTSTAAGGYLSTNLNSSPDWTMPAGTWTFTRQALLAKHPILGAYPGEVLDTSICWVEDFEYQPRYLASSGLTMDGRFALTSRPLRNIPTGTTCAFDSFLEPMPGLHPVISNSARVNLKYEEGRGLIDVEYIHPWGFGYNEFGTRVQLVGAILSGDTIFSPPAVSWTVGTIEEPATDFTIRPNPTSEFLLLSALVPGTRCSITDIQGRVVHQQRITSTNERIDVQALHPGAYLLLLDGLAPQRFIIAR